MVRKVDNRSKCRTRRSFRKQKRTMRSITKSRKMTNKRKRKNKSKRTKKYRKRYKRINHIIGGSPIWRRNSTLETEPLMGIQIQREINKTIKIVLREKLMNG